MRRADRLFQVIQVLRRKHVVTAAMLARDLEVSERTIYRDIRDLVISGVPIDGEAGVGYTLRRGFDLPPLMFTSDELAALVLGARVVASWGDQELAKSAQKAIEWVEAAVPLALRERVNPTPMFAPGFHVPPGVVDRLSDLRRAIEERNKAWMSYIDPKGNQTERTIWPLGLFFWGKTWTLSAWCELRNDFRDFRLDRVSEMQILADLYPKEEGKTLEEFFRRVEAEAEGRNGRRGGGFWLYRPQPHASESECDERNRGRNQPHNQERAFERPGFEKAADGETAEGDAEPGEAATDTEDARTDVSWDAFEVHGVLEKVADAESEAEHGKHGQDDRQPRSRCEHEEGQRQGQEGKGKRELAREASTDCAEDDVAKETATGEEGSHESEGDCGVQDGRGVDGNEKPLNGPDDEVHGEEVHHEGKKDFVAADQRPCLGERATEAWGLRGSVRVDDPGRRERQSRSKSRTTRHRPKGRSQVQPLQSAARPRRVPPAHRSTTCPRIWNLHALWSSQPGGPHPGGPNILPFVRGYRRPRQGRRGREAMERKERQVGGGR